MAFRFAFALILSYRYRLLPRQRQHRALEAILESQRQLYNAALEERIGAYRLGVVLSYFDQSKGLTVWRQSDPTGRSLPVSLQRATLKRLDAAYKAFFRRVKAGEKPGFPRFKGKGWFDTSGFSDFKGITLKGGKLRFVGVPGPLRVHLHRPMPEGATLRSCTFRREGRCWTVNIAVEVPAASPRVVQSAVGMDLGLTNFVALSDGELIPRLAAARKAERMVRVAQRSLARKQRASNGRSKARAAVARLHAAIRRQRTNHLHQASAHLVRNYDLIAIEDLNVSGLANSGLAKAVRDASWGRFISMLATRLKEPVCAWSMWTAEIPARSVLHAARGSQRSGGTDVMNATSVAFRSIETSTRHAISFSGPEWSRACIT